MRILASKLAFQIENAKLTMPEAGRVKGDMDEGMEERLRKVLATP